jgi:uncharacterized coiled-coil DUF342 family protein
MIEIDQKILKEDLPEDINRVLDQVNANVDTMVKAVVDKFRKQAEQIAQDFENRKFDAALQAKLDATKKDLQTDLDRMDALVDSVSDLAGKAAEAAKTAKESALGETIAELAAKTKELHSKLQEFRDKTNTFAEKAGGFIASSAIKAVTGGIG